MLIRLSLLILKLGKMTVKISSWILMLFKLLSINIFLPLQVQYLFFCFVFYLLYFEFTKTNRIRDFHKCFTVFLLISNTNYIMLASMINMEHILSCMLVPYPIFNFCVINYVVTSTSIVLTHYVTFSCCFFIYILFTVILMYIFLNICTSHG